MDKAESTKGRSYRRGELAEKYGIGIETLRYYEGIGLLEEPERDGNNYRRYSEEYEKALAFITSAKRRGFSLSEIKEFMALLRASAATPERMRAALDAKIEALAAQAAVIRERIALLEEMKASARLGECETMAALRKKP